MANYAMSSSHTRYGMLWLLELSTQLSMLHPDAPQGEQRLPQAKPERTPGEQRLLQAKLEHARLRTTKGKYRVYPITFRGLMWTGPKPSHLHPTSGVYDMMTGHKS